MKLLTTLQALALLMLAVIGATAGGTDAVDCGAGSTLSCDR